MQQLRYSFFSVLFLGLLFLGSCDNGSDPAPQTLAEKLSGSWRIQSATQNGTDVAFDISVFRLTFSADEGESSTYNVVPGATPDGGKPNFNGVADSGNWTITGTTSGSITFEDTASDNSIVNFTFDENAGTLILSWTAPLDVDKTQPEYVFTLVKS